MQFGCHLPMFGPVATRENVLRFALGVSTVLLARDLGLHYYPMPAEGPKSAYELAMERLRQKDREAGVEERPLTDEQKAAIAEARRIYQARMAEREILHQDALQKAQSREEVEKLESELARDRDRLANDRDRKIAEIKQQAK
jgi:hypothetical protein